MLILSLRVLRDGLRWSHAHLSRLKGLQTVPHGSLEDLLDLIFILVDAKLAATELVTVLLGQKEERT